MPLSVNVGLRPQGLEGLSIHRLQYQCLRQSWIRPSWPVPTTCRRKLPIFTCRLRSPWIARLLAALAKTILLLKPPVRNPPPRANGNGNGAARGNGRGPSPPPNRTKRAIQAICRRLGTDAEYEAQQLIGLPFLSLSIKQASELIDSLKAVEPPEAAPAGRNGGGR